MRNQTNPVRSWRCWIGKISVGVERKWIRLAQGKPIRQFNMQRLMNIEALTLPVFTVVDEGLISAEMCQDGPAGDLPSASSVLDNKLGAYRFAQFEISRAGSYTVRVATTG